MFVTKDLFNKESEKTVIPGEVNYNKTLIGSMLNLSSEEYYVMLVDLEAQDAIYYTGLIDSYKDNKEALSIYLADLNNPLNKTYISNEANLETSDLTKFKVQGPTLVKIKNGKITKSLTKAEEMAKELKYISEDKEEE